MPLTWIIFRVVCLLQLAVAAFVMLTSIINLVAVPTFSDVARVLLFLLVLMLSIFAISLLNSNYPDKPVEGSQKTAFNRLFLLNFVFLAVLFGFVFAEYRSAHRFAQLMNTSVIRLPFYFLVSLITYLVALIFQLIILYGLFVLRRLLYDNFRKQKFDFEK